MVKKEVISRMIICFICITLTYAVGEIYIKDYKETVETQTYYYGAKADIIYKVQYNLKKWGYYKGEIDGIYGYQTFQAIKAFQAKNGLKVDGVIGSRTLGALGLSTGTTNTSTRYSSNNSDVNLLARLINGEARGEPYEGQVAVGAVVLNRVRDSRFPSSVAGVIYQPGAFTAIVDGQINAKIEESSIKAARDALNGWDPSGGAMYYFNPAKATSKWIWSRPLIKIIGKHRFCK
ncbi:spore cortex-lytic enzyme [Haloimpatiens lingqiaonensis]|uniref:spore cortex-lytic enzyme n=1 Tax=Haloimpatiens lingqiaonensis TaxID=1380675 RepID=UPI0010FF13A9|nr:spore cortex-lytic enzyme [Haloimpatiens lingqiaonensis]